jgi:hypothetical protein
MCLLIGNGGSRPLSRSTRQSPSSEPATTTLERTNQQIDDEREKERQQQGDDETAWRAPVDANAASTVTPSTEKVAPPHRGRLSAFARRQELWPRWVVIHAISRSDTAFRSGGRAAHKRDLDYALGRGALPRPPERIAEKGAKARLRLPGEPAPAQDPARLIDQSNAAVSETRFATYRRGDFFSDDPAEAYPAAAWVRRCGVVCDRPPVVASPGRSRLSVGTCRSLTASRCKRSAMT